MPDADVVIVNWNSREFLRKCVASLEKAHEDAPTAIASVTVVDNASSDGSSSKLDPGSMPLHVIRNNMNVGFAAACNQGAREGAAPYILFLNPDAEASAEALQACIDFMNRPENRMVGICGVQLRDESGAVARTCARFPSPRMFLIGSLGLDRLSPHLFKRPRMAEWDHASTRPVDQVIGAFYLIRRDLFTRLGGFDERYFVYFEEVDLAYRARQNGYASVYLAGACAYHRGGGSSENVKARRLFYSLRSRLLYSSKHFSSPSALMVATVTLVIEPASRLAQAVMRRSLRSVLETLKGYMYLWAWLPGYLLFRKTR